MGAGARGLGTGHQQEQRRTNLRCTAPGFLVAKADLKPAVGVGDDRSYPPSQVACQDLTWATSCVGWPPIGRPHWFACQGDVKEANDQVRNTNGSLRYEHTTTYLVELLC
jgi:hypothetical protein